MVSVDHTSMTATLEPGLRGPEAEALLARRGPDPRALPPVVGVRVDRRLRRHPVQRPGQCRYGRFDALVVGLTVATPRGRLDLGSAPANAAGPDLRQLILGSGGSVRRDHLRDGAGARVAVDQGLRGLALAVVRRRCCRDADPGAGRAAADRDPALRRGRDRDQPGRSRRDRRGLARLDHRWTRVRDDRRIRGRAGGGGRQASRGHRGADRPRWHSARRGRRGEVGARSVRRAVPPRLDARRRRAGGDARRRRSGRTWTVCTPS